MPTLEQQVIRLVGSGQREAALLAVVAAFRRKVFGLAYSFLRDREEAEDLAQEVFVKVWKALHSFDGRATLSTWVYTITRNASLSVLRRRARSPAVDSEADVRSVEAISADTNDADAERALLLRLLDSLPDRQRQVVTLFYMEERSHDEVSAMLAMPIGTVKTLLHRARERLRVGVDHGQ